MQKHDESKVESGLPCAPELNNNANVIGHDNERQLHLNFWGALFPEYEDSYTDEHAVEIRRKPQ